MNRDDLPVVIFDGDDTLWVTEPLYDAARRAARDIVERAGLDGQTWEALQREIDVNNVQTMGLSADRFPTSCREAYERLAVEIGEAIQPSVARSVFVAAGEVFRSVAPSMPNAAAVVAALRGRHRVALLTQGDRAVQERRIKDSGLAAEFDLVRVVPRKDVSTLQDLLRDLRANADSAWMVGNSVPSDVNPALAVGMRAVWIDAHVWEHERREVTGSAAGLHVAHDLRAAQDVIESHSGYDAEPS